MKQATVDAFQPSDEEEVDRPDRIAAAYARPTTHSSGPDQLETTVTHAVKHLGYNISEENTDELRDGWNTITVGRGVTGPDENDAVVIYYDGDNTHPAGLEKLLSKCDDIDDIIIGRLTSLSDSIEDIIEIVEIINGSGATIYAVDENLVIPPGPDGDDVRTALQAAVRTDRDARPRITGQGQHNGRPPAGHRIENGQLRRDDDWDELRNALKQVNENEISTRQAAEVTGYSRATINSARKKHELYRLKD